MADLIIGELAFRVEVEGDETRPVLVLSHPLGGDLSIWDAQIESLAPHFRLVRYDTRGHGKSASGPGPVTIADLGRDALAILDALEIESAHWLGLSMGGAVGLWIMAHAPGRIEKAVLANTGPRLGSPAAWNDRIVAVRTLGTESLTAVTMKRWFSADFSARAADDVAAVAGTFGATSPEAYAACCAALRDMDLREAARGIQNEVLVISGRADETAPPEDGSSFAATLGNATHHILDAKHISNIEDAAGFNAAILNFLLAKPRSARRPRKLAPAPTASIKSATKRARATLHSNAARSPLKKAPGKRATTKKRPLRATATKKATARRRQPVKHAPLRPAAAKAAAKKPAKTTRKRVPSRRPTPLAAARVPTKAPAKKVKTKAPTKSPAKKVGKTATKRSPAPRRKPSAPRRPKGRRKS